MKDLYDKNFKSVKKEIGEDILPHPLSRGCHLCHIHYTRRIWYKFWHDKHDTRDKSETWKMASMANPAHVTDPTRMTEPQACHIQHA